MSVVETMRQRATAEERPGDRDRTYLTRTGPRHGSSGAVQPHRDGGRVLIYSHDTFGLGHMRRSRAIANALVAARPGVSVVIVSGSPVIGSFEFGHGVDHVRVPGVTKLPDGDYRSLNLNLSIDEAVRSARGDHPADGRDLRARPLHRRQGADGFRGEIMPALERLRARGCRIVLGVRDVHGRAGPAGRRNGSARAPRRRSAATTTRSGSTACARSTSRSPALGLPGRCGGAHHVHRLSAARPAPERIPDRYPEADARSPSSSSPRAAAATART